MYSSEQGISGEMLYAFADELRGLSGKYGDIHESEDGYLISNDEGYAEVFPYIKEKLADKHGGVGLFVGGGGALSLLPDLPVDVVTMLDADRSVLGFNEALVNLIATSSSPERVLERLSTDELPQRYQVTSQLAQEADEYGDFHWTNPARYPQVQDALKSKPIIFMAADLSDEEFATCFSDVVSRFNTKVSFANFTNVHSYIKNKPMDFLEDWPFDHDVTVLYSSKKDVELGHFPQMHVAEGIQDYIESTKLDQ